MKFTARAFWTPKKGNLAEEYEDAYDYRLAERRFAVADGATEAAFSDRWARSLVQRFTAAPPSPFPDAEEPLDTWLRPIQQRWHKTIDWDRLPWFAQDKARAGAFATMLGMEFFDRAASAADTDEEQPNGARWCALAVGDSCLFQVREDELLAKFPVSEAGEFNTSPMLVSSNPGNNPRIKEHIRIAEGHGQPGDLFFLATDALSHWFLARCEAGEKPWQTLCALKDNEEFAAFCKEWRDKQDEEGKRAKSAMRNDDVTLLIVAAQTDEFVLDETDPQTTPPPLQLQEAEAAAQGANTATGAATLEHIAAATLSDDAPVAASDPALSPALAEGEETIEQLPTQFDPEATLAAPETARAEIAPVEVAPAQAEPAATASDDVEAAPTASDAAPSAGEQAASQTARSEADEQAEAKVTEEQLGEQ